MNNTMINNFNTRGDQYMKSNIRAKKKLVRDRMKARRKELTREYIEEASGKIADTLLSSEAYRDAKVIFCYMNYGNEVQTDRIIGQALADGKTVCIPLCLEEHQMEAKKYTSDSELVPGAYGIREPRRDAETVDPDEIDLAVIPCLSCDSRGNRLGHGAGYYDRFMEGRSFRKTALCFKRLQAANVAVDDLDVRMDEVITEEKNYVIEPYSADVRE